jgi:hypothetical protein
MKSLSGFLLLLLITLSQINAQSLDGVYINREQKIILDGTNIEYTLTTGGGLSTIFSGSGFFDIKGNHLLIKPDIKPTPKLNLLQSINSLNTDTMSINVSCEDSIPFIVRFLRKGREIFYLQSERIGIKKVARQLIKDCDSIIVQMIGYSGVGIKPDNQIPLDYSVRLYPETESDFHIGFVTNYGKGFKLKMKTNKIYLKYKRTKHYKDRDVWQKFVKEK